jgi:7-cyano-7-deazaguanine synthase
MAETIEQVRERVRKAQKNYKMNTSLLEDVLLQERGYVTRIPRGEDVVVLYSGGLDSTVMIDMLIKEWDVKVHPLYVKRGARAEKQEEKAVDYYYDYYKQKYPSNIGELAKINYQVPPEEFKKDFPPELAKTQGHPLRNSTLQNLAVMYCVSIDGKYNKQGKSRKVRTIISGSIGEDGTEPELGLLSLRSQTLNTCIQMGDWEWQIVSPFTDTIIRDKPLYKKDLIKYAAANNIPLEYTRTCFSADEEADGSCFACQKRLKAFEEAGVKDPVKYKRGDDHEQ